jgi:hypothetical protein
VDFSCEAGALAHTGLSTNRNLNVFCRDLEAKKPRHASKPHQEGAGRLPYGRPTPRDRAKTAKDVNQSLMASRLEEIAS